MQSGFGKTWAEGLGRRPGQKTWAGIAGDDPAHAFASCSRDGTIRQIMFSRQVLKA